MRSKNSAKQGRAKSSPYSRPERDDSDKTKKGRGTFRYGKDGGGDGGGGGGGGGKGKGGGGGGGGGAAESVFVGGLAPSVDWRTLKEHMLQVSRRRSCPALAAEPLHNAVLRPQAGEVVRADVVEGRGYGIVTFVSAKAAKAAIRDLNESGAPASRPARSPAPRLTRVAVRAMPCPELEGKTLAVRPDKGGGGGKGKGGRRGGDDDEPDGVYSYSGLASKSGWVKPDGSNFDDAPPPDPRGSDLAR
jgi:hypothetical protein